MIATLRNFPGATGILSTVSAWATVDFLRASQIFAAFFAGLVSFCTFMIILPRMAESVSRVPESFRKIKAAIVEIFKKG